jgi:hypothetical protein
MRPLSPIRLIPTGPPRLTESLRQLFADLTGLELYAIGHQPPPLGPSSVVAARPPSSADLLERLSLSSARLYRKLHVHTRTALVLRVVEIVLHRASIQGSAVPVR